MTGGRRKPGAGRKPGTPKTGGRVKGTPNKRTAEFLEKVLGSNKTPLEVMLEIMWEPAPKSPTPAEVKKDAELFMKWQADYCAWRERTLDAASKAAPYCHPKLMAQVNPLDADKPPVQRVEVTVIDERI